MRKKVIVRKFVFLIKMIKNHKIIYYNTTSSIVPARRKEDYYITKQPDTDPYKYSIFVYPTPPYSFLSGNSIEDIFSTIIETFQKRLEQTKKIEKQISSEIQDLLHTEVDNYFIKNRIKQPFEINFKYNQHGQIATFPFMTMYKFVNVETQNELMKYAKKNLTAEEFDLFDDIVKQVW